MNIDIGIEPYRIRNFLETDIQSIVHHANNKKIAENLRDIFPHPYTIEDAETWLKHVKTQKPVTDFAVANSKEAIGGIGLEFLGDIHYKTAGLDYWLGEEYWGRGIMTNVVMEFTKYAFNVYDLIRIFAHVFDTNPASARVLGKAGYTFEGKLRKNAIKNGKILDQLLFSKVT
jgi:RimJ/RimL family protein N-acetyltransferase